MKTYNVILLIRVLLLYSFSNVSVLLKTFGPCEVTPCTMTNYMLLLLQTATLHIFGQKKC